MAKRKRRKSKAEWTKTDWVNWAWKKFSLYIRVRDCLRTTGTTMFGCCVTCGRKYPIGKLQAGHFIPGRTDAILFAETQVYAQCYRCNCKLQGMWHMYYQFMLSEGYTHEDIQEMIIHSDDPVDLTPEYLQELGDWCDAKVVELTS